jgi:hypothetical protein
MDGDTRDPLPVNETDSSITAKEDPEDQEKQGKRSTFNDYL